MIMIIFRLLSSDGTFVAGMADSSVRSTAQLGRERPVEKIGNVTQALAEDVIEFFAIRTRFPVRHRSSMPVVLLELALEWQNLSVRIFVSAITDYFYCGTI
ncbi:Hypothetical protein NTJ_03606 [Nesidiocoris tenuis]|uniref:Uncharacterized protein n=1 Tax=Nesidiocoris tenuis TaxID=355587 RepID=A0ABN7AHN6_9HEMI|nr:Hypothetical protein NTJ_03606 [Nesidiocoris tenuis]